MQQHKMQCAYLQNHNSNIIILSENTKIKISKFLANAFAQISLTLYKTLTEVGSRLLLLHLPRSKVKTVVHTYPDAGVEKMFDRR